MFLFLSYTIDFMLVNPICTGIIVCTFRWPLGSSKLISCRESKGTLLTYWNNFVPACEPWVAENQQPTVRQARLNGAGSQHTLPH